MRQTIFPKATLFCSHPIGHFRQIDISIAGRSNCHRKEIKWTDQFAPHTKKSHISPISPIIPFRFKPKERIVAFSTRRISTLNAQLFLLHTQYQMSLAEDEGLNQRITLSGLNNCFVMAVSRLPISQQHYIHT